jgi:hypothetical protein
LLPGQVSELLAIIVRMVVLVMGMTVTVCSMLMSTRMTLTMIVRRVMAVFMHEHSVVCVSSGMSMSTTQQSPDQEAQPGEDEDPSKHQGGNDMSCRGQRTHPRDP